MTRVPEVGAPPLGFGGKLRILRTMRTPAALRGVEASHISLASATKLRAEYVRVATSGNLPMASPGAVLSLLVGPPGCDPGYHAVWCRFRLFRRYMAYDAGILDLVRIYGVLRAVCNVAPGHGPMHLLLESASENWFQLGSC